MDLSAIKKAVDAAVRDNVDGNMEDVMLIASSALPSEASDFDRGMAAGFAAGWLLGLKRESEEGISQINS